MAFEESPVAQVVAGLDRRLVAANRRARSLFGLDAGAVGRRLENLPVPDQPIDVRSLLDQVMEKRRSAVVHELQWTNADGDEENVEATLLPLDAGATSGVMISFTPVDRHEFLRRQLDRSRGEIQDAYEELRSTADDLQATNEELRSSNDALDITCRQLRSTSEELAIMNETLRSTNEQLESANDELRSRSIALDEADTFLESVVDNLRPAVVVMAADMTVRAWNHAAEDLWAVPADEVDGAGFLDIDVGLPVDQLREAVRSCLDGTSVGDETRLSAVNRRGRTVQCLVTVTPLRAGRDVIGAMVFMDAER